MRDYYAFSKAQDRKFSYRFFARISGINSPSFLKHVIDGERNLTLSSIVKFAKALKFNKQETSFFKSLVLLNQSTSTNQKEIHARELLKHRLFIKFQTLSVAQLSYFEHWYYVAVRELVSIEAFKSDPDWIAKQISPPITSSEAKKALSELIKLGLLKFDDLGKLVQSDMLISTGNEVSSAFVARFHKEMMIKASEAIDRFEKPQREISSGTFGVSQETFKIIKEKTQEFRKEMQELAAKDSHQDFVCQLNFQVFPLSLPNGEKSKGENE